MFFIALCCHACTEESHKCHNVISLAESSSFIKEETEKNIKILEAEKHHLDELCTKTSDETSKIDDIKKFVKEKFEIVKDAVKKKENDILEAIEKDTSTGKFDDIIGKANIIREFIEDEMPKVQGLLNDGVTVDSVHKAILIAENIKEAKEVKKKSKGVTDYKFVLDTSDFEADIEKVRNLVSSTRDATIREKKIFVLKQVGPFSVSFEWDKNYQDNGYSIILQKEEERYGLVCQANCTENAFSMDTLEPETTYKAFIQVKRGDLCSYWSNPFIFKTTPLTIETVIEALRMSHAINYVCVAALEGINKLTANRIRKLKLSK